MVQPFALRFYLFVVPALLFGSAAKESLAVVCAVVILGCEEILDVLVAPYGVGGRYGCFLRYQALRAEMAPARLFVVLK